MHYIAVLCHFNAYNITRYMAIASADLINGWLANLHMELGYAIYATRQMLAASWGEPEAAL